ncbi:sugar phosphate isomerase/epimerase [Candidatus Poribacteria bacterium]|nr:sugar phosphate isomerase/epimerase [Candidatus Poribacteria bacterium]
MSKIPIGLELYSVREQLAKDPRGTIKAVAEMGYVGVEFAGFPSPDPAEVKGWLDEFKLTCCGSHTGWGLVQDDKLESTVAYNKAIGNRYLIVPGLPGELTRTRADWIATAKKFNAISAKLVPQGMATGYHNHSAEFQVMDGETAWDAFFSHTDKEVVMQLDMGNGMSGGADLVGILKKFPGRAETVHLKPYHKTEGFRPVIGKDDVPWQEVFHLCETTGNTKWYIVEYESDAYPPLEAVERCLKGLQKMGK